MRFSSFIIIRGAAFAGAAAVALVAMAPSSASTTGLGSDNTMFKLHFWRGQAYHGAGYPPRVSDIGRERLRDRTSDPFEATVID